MIKLWQTCNDSFLLCTTFPQPPSQMFYLQITLVQKKRMMPFLFLGVFIISPFSLLSPHSPPKAIYVVPSYLSPSCLLSSPWQQQVVPWLFSSLSHDLHLALFLSFSTQQGDTKKQHTFYIQTHLKFKRV